MKRPLGTALAVLTGLLLQFSGCGGGGTDAGFGESDLAVGVRQKAALTPDQTAALSAIYALLLEDPDPLVPDNPKLSLSSSEYARLYGPGVDSIDLLSNFYVGRIAVTGGVFEYLTSMRFRAPVSGQMSSIRTYYPDNAGTSGGYASGTGGTLQIRVYPDDGTAKHFPDLTQPPLASTTRDQAALGMVNGVFAQPQNRFSPDTFAAGTPLVAGALYHVVWQNVASDPAANWSSINVALGAQAGVRPTRWLDPTDFAALYGARPASSNGAFAWNDSTVTQRSNAESDGTTSTTYVVPILQVTMTDDSGNPKTFGNGPMESGTEASRNYTASSGQIIRERFTISEPGDFGGLSFLTAASAAGTLNWQLKDLSGNVVTSGTITQSTPDYSIKKVFGGNFGQFKWRDVAFPSTVTLASGIYDLDFTPASGTWVWKSQNNGSPYGFTYPAAFTQSYAKYFDGTNWYAAYFFNRQAPAGTETQMNWPVVLHRMPPA